jgi:hypothetical protein
VNPDQLSLLIHGAEYNNVSVENPPVITAFGSGCGQMAALLGDLDESSFLHKHFWHRLMKARKKQ